MATRVITVLGAREMTETTYRWTYHDGTPVSHISRYASLAVAHIFRAKELIALCTYEARNSLEMLQTELSRTDATQLTLTQVDIQDGMDEGELWRVFQNFASHFPETDDIVFDITNGYRSLPLLVMSAFRFMQLLSPKRRVRVVYGAFQPNEPLLTTIVDLQPVLDIQRWTDAAFAFVRYGQGSELQLVAQAVAKRLGHDGADSPWNKAATAVAGITDALQLVDLVGLGTHVDKLNAALAELVRRETESAGEEGIPLAFNPLILLLQSVAERYALFATQRTPLAELRRQQKILQWYMNHRQYAQAVLMAQVFLECNQLRKDNERLPVKQRMDTAALFAQWVDRPPGIKINDAGMIIPRPGRAPLNVPYRIRRLRNSVAHGRLRVDPNAPQGSDIIELCCDFLVQLKI